MSLKHEMKREMLKWLLVLCFSLVNTEICHRKFDRNKANMKDNLIVNYYVHEFE